MWHLEPSLDRSGHGLRRGRGRGAVPVDRRRADLARAVRAAHARSGPALAAGRRRDVPAHDHPRSDSAEAGSSSPSRPRARSAPTTAAQTWQPINQRPAVGGHPGPDGRGRPLRAPHRACTRRGPSVLFMQKHWDVMRSDDAGDSWREVSGNLPTDFGFPIDVHAHEPDTVYVVPITSDSEHFPPEGKLRVYRSRTGGDEWEPLTTGLPQRDCYVNVLRDAMAVDSLDSCGVYFGTTGGQVYASADAATAGRRSCGTCRPCCRSRCRRCHDPGRAPGPPARPGAAWTARCGRGRPARSPSGRCWTPWRPATRCCAGPSATSAAGKRRAFVRFFACEQDLSHEPPDDAAARGGRGGHRAVPDRRRDGRRLAAGQDRAAQVRVDTPSAARMGGTSPSGTAIRPRARYRVLTSGACRAAASRRAWSRATAPAWQEHVPGGSHRDTAGPRRTAWLARLSAGGRRGPPGPRLFGPRVPVQVAEQSRAASRPVAPDPVRSQAVLAEHGPGRGTAAASASRKCSPPG